MLKISFLLSACLFSCVVHGECKMSAYKIYGVVTNSTGQKIPASIRFSWLENETKERSLSVLTDGGDYFATFYFDAQSKADKASGRLYNCDAELASVQYVIEASGYLALKGSLKLSGLSTEANFTLPNPSFERDAAKARRPSTLRSVP